MPTLTAFPGRQVLPSPGIQVTTDLGVAEIKFGLNYVVLGASADIVWPYLKVGGSGGG